MTIEQWAIAIGTGSAAFVGTLFTMFKLLAGFYKQGFEEQSERHIQKQRHTTAAMTYGGAWASREASDAMLADLRRTADGIEDIRDSLRRQEEGRERDAKRERDRDVEDLQRQVLELRGQR